MSDITMMRGYGFPKGSGMDYAGYRGFGAVVTNPRRRAPSMVERIPFVPEPSIFAKIPALDGLGEDFGTAESFGTEYNMQLPELDLSPGAADPSQQPGWADDSGGGAPVGPAPSVGMSPGVKLLGGLALAWFIFGR